jgi:ATP adenylyltransferase
VKVLWAPWRLSYVSSADTAHGCIFCDLPRADGAEACKRNLVLYRDDRVQVLMNRFPYAHAHLMVAPREHTADFAGLSPEAALAVHSALQHAQTALHRVYSPGGYNIGMNLGRIAGAGVADHLHWHIVPRWEGDTNFMPLFAETRVMPQHIDEAYDRLLPHFDGLAAGGEGTRNGGS